MNNSRQNPEKLVDVQTFEYLLYQTLYTPSHLQAMAAKIEELIGFPVYFMNFYWEFYASSPGIQPKDVIKLSDLLHAAQLNSNDYKDYLAQKAELSVILGESPAIVYIPKHRRNYLFAYSYTHSSRTGIVVFPEKGPSLSLLTNDYIQIILRLFSVAQVLHESAVKKQPETRGWNQVFSLLFSGKISTKKELLPYLQSNSFTIYFNSYVIFVFSVRSKAIQETDTFFYLSQYLQTLQQYHIWFEYEGNLVMILSDNIAQKNTKEYIQSDSFQKVTKDLDLYVGYSNTCLDLLEAKQAYRDAVTAARFARRWDTSMPISSYEECKLYDLLYHVEGTSLRQYVSQSILLIQEYDATHDSDYFRTLELLFTNRMNLTSAAEQLFIHKSTLFYRMQQMRKLFLINWDDPTAVLHLQLSLYILKYFLTQ